MILEEYELEDMSEPGNREWYQIFAEALFKSQGSDKNGSCTVSQYPNLLPEVLFYAFGLSALAKEAKMQVRTITNAIELGTMLTPVQLKKLARALNVDVEYLSNPRIASVKCNSASGIRQRKQIGELLAATEGLCVPKRDMIQILYEQMADHECHYARVRTSIQILRAAVRHPLPCGNEPGGKVMYIDRMMAL